MVRILSVLVCLLTVFGSPVRAQAPSAERNLVLQFEPDGRVRLLAHNVSVQEIFAEWARLCGCFVVNGNQLPASTLTVPILFDGAPQASVLRSLLKDAGGYVLTPRRAGASGPSIYETIYVLPAGRPAPVASFGTPFGTPFAPQVTPVTPGSPDDEIEPVRPVITPLPIDPAVAEPPQEAVPTRPGVPGVSVPAVQVMPITPGGPTPGAPTPGTPVPTPPAPPAPPRP